MLTWDILYDEGVVISAAKNGDVTDYTYGLERISASTGKARTEYVYDGRGSVIGEVTKSGLLSTAKVTTKAYTPFGKQIGEATSGFGWNGEYYNAATGQVYLRARFYEPEMNQFSQKDILRGNIAVPTTLNRYLYCYNDPLNYIDPNGQLGLFGAAAAIGAIAGGITGAVSSVINAKKAGEKVTFGKVITGTVTGAAAGAAGSVAAVATFTATGSVKAAAVVGATVGGAVAGGISGAVNGIKQGKNLGGVVKSSLGGAAHGAARGGATALVSVALGGTPASIVAANDIVGAADRYITSRASGNDIPTSLKQAADPQEIVTDTVMGMTALAAGQLAQSIVGGSNGGSSAKSVKDAENPKVENPSNGKPYACNQTPKSGEEWNRYLSEEYGAENITWESQNSSSSIWSPKEGLDGLGNSVQIEGRGSTGRTVANTLEEQLAMEQVKSNPLDGAEELSTIKLGDPRWDSRSGWVKMSNTVELSDGSTIEIHFLYNKITGFFDDFKFKDY